MLANSLIPEEMVHFTRTSTALEIRENSALVEVQKIVTCRVANYSLVNSWRFGSGAWGRQHLGRGRKLSGVSRHRACPPKLSFPPEEQISMAWRLVVILGELQALPGLTNGNARHMGQPVI